MLINSKSLSKLLAVCGLGIAMIFSGCAAPGICGNAGCSDCDGVVDGPIIGGPIDGLRRLKRQMVCGSGCGEAYYGEWTSTPPDACDPCEGDQFVGGATPCRPFCWRPGMFLGSLYGVRFCDDCGHSFDDCGCGGGVSHFGGHDSNCGCDGTPAGLPVASSGPGTGQRIASPQSTSIRTGQRPSQGRTISGRNYRAR